MSKKRSSSHPPENPKHSPSPIKSCLFDQEEDGRNNNNVSIDDLKINSAFAEKFQATKEREELKKLEEKHAFAKSSSSKKSIEHSSSPTNTDHSNDDDDSDGSSNESSVEEDEDGVLLTPEIDAKILETVSVIRAKEPSIYDPKVTFFTENDVNNNVQIANNIVEKEKNKPVTVREYQTKRILEGADLKDDNDDEKEVKKKAADEWVSFAEEQAYLKAQLFSTQNNEENGKEEGDFLRVKPKSKEDLEREDNEYRDFLLSTLSKSQHAEQTMQEWLAYKDLNKTDISSRNSSTKAELDDENFLVNYILNRGWIEKKPQKKASWQLDAVVDVEDEKLEEATEEFETTYNFRFEQPGAASIQSYARPTSGNASEQLSSLRLLSATSASRKRARESKAERKRAAKLAEEEELKRLKSLRAKDLRARFKKLKKAAGLSGKDKVFEELLGKDDDFELEEWDKKMQAIFDDQYYAQSDDDIKTKEEASAEVEENSSVNKVKVTEEDFKETKGVKKFLKKIKEKKGENAQREDKLTAFIQEALDSLHYEDKIADGVKCKFKYASVPPTTFGLEMEEILGCEDADLASFVSIKKLAPYLPSERQQSDAKRYGNKRRLFKWRSDLRARQQQSQKEHEDQKG